MIRRPPKSTPFPYPTLFRPRRHGAAEPHQPAGGQDRRGPEPPGPPLLEPADGERRRRPEEAAGRHGPPAPEDQRSEEHTSELQSRQYLVCRLLLEKKKLDR